MCSSRAGAPASGAQDTPSGLAGLDPAVGAYAAAVRDRLAAALGPDLAGVYLHGSAALGGFHPARSDVDLLALVAAPPPAAARRALVERLTDPALRCPAAHGLELHLVAAAVARSPTPSPRFELHLAHAPADAPAPDPALRPPERLPGTRVVDGAGGDPDLLLCFAVCRRAGRTLAGPPAAQAFAEPPRAWLLAAAAGELRWSLRHASFAYRVLTTCRAWWLCDAGALGSKLDAGAWARRRLPDPDVLDAALAAQRGLAPMPRAPADLAAADRFVGEILARLAGARR